MTIGEALRDAAVRLEPIGGTGRLDAVFLLAHAGGVSRQEMIAHAERRLDDDVAQRFAALVEQRAAGMPMAYVTGEAGFYGRMFGVDRRVLVPRPETEIAIEWAVRHLRAIGRENGSAADVGTGSGAIAVTLACELPGLGVCASDVSFAALAVARRNAARNNVFQHVTFLTGDLAAPLLRFAPYDAVVANLPYVPTAECAGPPDPVSYEPLVARDGGPDGLELYRRFLPDLARLVAPRGIAILEAAPANARTLEALVGQALPHAGVETIRDYADLDRFVIAVIPPANGG
ncbi:release factor glutamine methyltransferase [Vulcanimicrobium alpinum]|uniref:Release factor glutamine methyltransferase n=1 Tax=Vulcanimicrobium alpinum TaxID=3016050 RepID=A0AAN2C9S6_UNVUL|nr:peptide chain release factor N(5)-glutamine methyltransferase [Vulcanimicrobium alpinum]BDE06341.1 release factor glutamine methyltransferase [Vulcanimicrobium alpinum]